MEKDLLLKILLFIKEHSANNKVPPFSNTDVPDYFSEVTADELDDHLWLLKNDGLIDAERTDSGWHIRGLTLKGYAYLADAVENTFSHWARGILKQGRDNILVNGIERIFWFIVAITLGAIAIWLGFR